MNLSVGTVKSASLVKPINSEIALCKVQIDFDEYYIYDNYNDLMNFLNKKVEYAVKQDVLDGLVVNVVVKFLEHYKVQTVEQVENVRLIPENANERVVMNFAIKDIKYGEFEPNCVFYLSSVEPGASDKSKWIDCAMVDKEAKVFNLRIFNGKTDTGEDALEVMQSYVGKYVQADIEHTKYGFQTKRIDVLDDPVVVPPEVAVAKEIVRKVIEDDPYLQAYEAKHNFLEVIEKTIDIEPGYCLVKMATEIYLINAMKNITMSYDYKTMYQAVITSRGYLIPSSVKYSHTLMNTRRATLSNPSVTKDLMLILDVGTTEPFSPTKSMYLKIHQFANDIIAERRGLNETSDINPAISSARVLFGELF